MWAQKETKIFLESGWHLRDIGVFQSQAAEVKHAHGCSTTNEDEKRDELSGKEWGTEIRLMKLIIIIILQLSCHWKLG